MSVTFDNKQLIEKFKQGPKDTGSTQVQVALLNERLRYLNEHFNKNPKDHGSRRGLMKLVGQRRRLLNYLQSKNPKAYDKLIQDLGIRVSKT